MIFAVVSLFILAFVQMLALGQLQERVVNLEKVVLALSMVTKMDKFKKGLKDEE